MDILRNVLACEQEQGKERGITKRNREPVRMAKVFDFQMLVNLCHVQINNSGRKHNNNGLFLIDYTATKLGQYNLSQN